MTAPLYSPHSIHGRAIGSDHTITFRVHFPGVVDPTTIPKNTAMDLHPALYGDDGTTPGEVFIEIGLPRPGADPYLLLSADISTNSLGLYARRAPKPDEINAILNHWEDLRDAAIRDTQTGADCEQQLSEVLAAFDHAAPTITATSWRTRRQYAQDHARILLAGQGAPTRTLRPLPALASQTPKPAQTPSATPLQAAIQAAIVDSEGQLSDMGNGYAWAVEIVAETLLRAMQPHVPGLDPSDYAYTP